MILLLIVFLGQLVVSGIIVAVLKNILDANLIDGAIRHLEYRPETKIIPINRLLVVTHKPLEEKYQQRILKALNKNFSLTVPPDYRADPKILGGMMVWIDEKLVDYSLRDRLKQAFPVLPL